MQDQKKTAAFVTVRLPNGKIAATTRAADRGEAGRIGLPGGKPDPGETLWQAALREAKEEGWEVEGLNHEPYHVAMVGDYECSWFLARDARTLDDYKEYGRIKPIEVDISALKTPELGNDLAMLAFEARTQHFMALNNPFGHSADMGKVAGFQRLLNDLWAAVIIDITDGGAINIDVVEYGGAWQDQLSEDSKESIKADALEVMRDLCTIGARLASRNMDDEQCSIWAGTIDVGPKYIEVSRLALYDKDGSSIATTWCMHDWGELLPQRAQSSLEV